MGITYTIDHEQRLVLARGLETVTAEDLFQYQKEVWSRPDVQGYDEIVDMSAVTHIVRPTPDGMRELAEFSAKMDASSSGAKFAIVAPDDVAFGLGRMYEAFRAVNEQSTKQVQVFRTLPEARLWLAEQEQSEEMKETNPAETG